MRRFLALVIFCISYSYIFANDTDTIVIIEYDTVYVTQDTLVEVVELIEYEYKYYDPLCFYIGSGLSFQNNDIVYDGGKFVENYFTVPLILRLCKNKFYIETGIQYNSFQYTTYLLDSIMDISQNSIIEKIVVDTIYKQNQIEPIVFYKDVVRYVNDTSYNDTLLSSSHKLSCYYFPLLLGCNFTRKSFIANISTGINFQLYNLKTQDYNNIDYQYITTYDFDYMLEISLGYQISKRISVECDFARLWKLTNNTPHINSRFVELKFLYKIFR